MIKATHVVALSVIGLTWGFFWSMASGPNDPYNRGVGLGLGIAALAFAILAWSDQE